MPELLLSQLAGLFTQHGFRARVDGNDRTVGAVNTLERAGDGEITFLSNPKYAAAVRTTRASAIIARDGVEVPDHLPAIRCEDPYAGVTIAIIALHGHRRHPQWGLSSGARIAASAQIGRNANIADGATIAADVRIGDDCTIYPGCYVGDRTIIGNRCTLYPNVVIYDDSVLGDRVTVHAGSVIGQDGLGYAPQGETWIKIPQVGRAVLGNDVEIGANCAIDRATLGETTIGDGTKFGNCIVIGHGTRVGPNCMFVGLVGVAGSVTIGRHVTLAGQVGVAGHIQIGDNVQVGAQAGIAGSVESNTKLLGSPAMPVEEARRSMIAVQKLPDWLKRVKELEAEVRRLRDEISRNGT